MTPVVCSNYSQGIETTSLMMINTTLTLGSSLQSASLLQDLLMERPTTITSENLERSLLSTVWTVLNARTFPWGSAPKMTTTPSILLTLCKRKESPSTAKLSSSCVLQKLLPKLECMDPTFLRNIASSRSTLDLVTRKRKRFQVSLNANLRNHVSWICKAKCYFCWSTIKSLNSLKHTM